MTTALCRGSFVCHAGPNPWMTEDGALHGSDAVRPLDSWWSEDRGSPVS